METLEKISPIPVRLDVAGERISLTPIKTKELPAMLKALGPVLQEVESGDLLEAIVMDAGSVIEAVAIGSRKPRAWVDELDLDDLVSLAGAVIEVNADFFSRAVMPTAMAAIEKLTSLTPGPSQSTP